METPKTWEQWADEKAAGIDGEKSLEMRRPGRMMLLKRSPGVSGDRAKSIIAELLQTPIENRSEKYQQLLRDAFFKPVPKTFDWPSAAAAILLAAEVTDVAVAVQVFAAADWIPWSAARIESATRLATGLADRESGIDDTVLEPFRIAGWFMGQRSPIRDEDGVPQPNPMSGFDDAVERDARHCPLRAAEVATEIARAVGRFNDVCAPPA
jgi:hypothetical protein